MSCRQMHICLSIYLSIDLICATYLNIPLICYVVHIYTYPHICLSTYLSIDLICVAYLYIPDAREGANAQTARLRPYKIFVYFSSFVHETSDLSFIQPACIAHTVAILLHDYWAIYNPPSASHLYAIHLTRLAMAISCKGQEHDSVPRIFGECIYAYPPIYLLT